PALLPDALKAGPEFRLTALVLPRRAAIERQRVAEANPEGEDQGEGERGGLDSALAGMERLGFGGALKDALWYGVPGAFARIPVSLRSLKGRVGTFRGVPNIFRSPRRDAGAAPDQLPPCEPAWMPSYCPHAARCVCKVAAPTPF